ncbi:unnamed protein product [Caenorhabditis brenneri]
MIKTRKELQHHDENLWKWIRTSVKNATQYLNAIIAEIQQQASISNQFPESYSTTNSNRRLCPGSWSIDFAPERFLENKNLAQRLIPFGVGKRACTGEALARAELYLERNSNFQKGLDFEGSR